MTALDAGLLFACGTLVGPIRPDYPVASFVAAWALLYAGVRLGDRWWPR